MKSGRKKSNAHSPSPSPRIRSKSKLEKNEVPTFNGTNTNVNE